MNEDKIINKLKINDRICIADNDSETIYIRKVMYGWIYEYYDNKKSILITAVHVPSI